MKQIVNERFSAIVRHRVPLYPACLAGFPNPMCERFIPLLLAGDKSLHQNSQGFLPFLDRHLLHQFDDLIRSKINRWHRTLNLEPGDAIFAGSEVAFPNVVCQLDCRRP